MLSFPFLRFGHGDPGGLSHLPGLHGWSEVEADPRASAFHTRMRTLDSVQGAKQPAVSCPVPPAGKEH